MGFSLLPSFETFIADRRVVADRGDYLVEIYLTNPDGLTYTFRSSLRGSKTGDADIVLGSDTLPAHTRYPKRLIKSPVMTQSIWSPGSILSSSSTPTYGSIVETNQDGGLDFLHPQNGYIWANAQCKVFFCDTTDISNTISKIYHGLVSNPEFTLSDVTIPLIGFESIFNTTFKQRVYRGTSYGLELFGSHTVSFGNPAAVNTRTSMTAEGWFWFELFATTDPRRFWGHFFSGAEGPWQVAPLANGKITVRCTIGGVENTVTSTKTLVVKRFYHIAFIISGRDLTFVFFDEELWEETIETHVNAFSSSTRDTANASGNYVFRTGGDATLRPWFDDIRVWNLARTLSQVRSNRHRPLSSPYPASLVHYAKCDNGTGTTVTDSSATASHGTISGTGTATWLWMMQGGPELAGVPLQDVWGKRFGVEPVLVDPIRYVYSLGNWPISSIATYEGGNPHTMNGNTSSLRSLMISPPSAGNSLPYLERALFRLGSKPTLPISALVSGHNGGSLGYVETADRLIRDLTSRRGPKLAYPADYDTSSFAALASVSTAVMGFVVRHQDDSKDSKSGSSSIASTLSPSARKVKSGSGPKIKDYLDLIMRSIFGWWGYESGAEQLHVERASGPSALIDHNFDQRQIIDIKENKIDGVIYEVVVRYHFNDVVHDLDQVATGIVGTANWQQWTLPYLEESSYDPDLKSQYEGEEGISLTIETALFNAEDAKALADYILPIVKGVRLGWSVTLNSAGLIVNINDTESISYVDARARTRLGLDGTRKYWVLSVTTNRQEGQIKNEIWG